MAPLLTDRLLPYTMPNRVIISPINGEEWKIVLKSVKVLYLKRQYKQCASRSTEILKGDKDPVSVLLTTLTGASENISNLTHPWRIDPPGLQDLPPLLSSYFVRDHGAFSSQLLEQ
jgi:hypothetical protein